MSFLFLLEQRLIDLLGHWRRYNRLKEEQLNSGGIEHKRNRPSWYWPDKSTQNGIMIITVLIFATKNKHFVSCSVRVGFLSALIPKI